MVQINIRYYTVSVWGPLCRSYTFRGWCSGRPVVSRSEGLFWGVSARFDLVRLSSGGVVSLHEPGAPLKANIYKSVSGAEHAAASLRAYFGPACRVEIIGHE